MVWRCFSRDMIGPLHEINGTMNGEMCKNIISDVMLSHSKNKMPRGWIFQQYNVPKHTSRVAKQFFESKKIRLLKWPHQSLNLNPIEHQWDHFERQIKRCKTANKRELIEKIKIEWAKIPLDVLINLFDSMPLRFAAVTKAKGYPTKY